MRSKRLRGILNGIDYDVWNPAADRHIAKSYRATSPSGKAACKKALQARLKLAQGKMPIIALVSRLAAQKGFDLLEQLLPYLLKMNVQLVVLGLGEKPYEDLFKKAAKDFPDRVSISLEFNEELAHQIYAGADMFLMPSRYEPCGLGQLISLRYGTVPIVRATGGLADTVEDFNPIKGKGNGFSFSEYSSVALMGTLARALLTYEDRAVWKQLVEKGLKEDHSWQSSAKEYVKAYKEAMAQVKIKK
jgi:starch synthase